jgi:hypothetical protein
MGLEQMDEFDEFVCFTVCSVYFCGSVLFEAKQESARMIDLLVFCLFVRFYLNYCFSFFKCFVLSKKCSVSCKMMQQQRFFLSLPSFVSPLLSTCFTSTKSLTEAMEIDHDLFKRVLHPVCEEEHFIAKTLPFFQKLVRDEKLFAVI